MQLRFLFSLFRYLNGAVILFSIFLLPNILVAAKSTASKINLLAQQRESMIRQIDSLDLVKQQQKRQGKSIIEIEQVQNSLRDSATHLKTSIQTLSAHTPATRPPSQPLHFFPKPTNLFDWIIVIVGAIATLSGIFLIAGIMRSIKTKRKRARRQRMQQQYRTMNSTTPVPAPAQPAYPEASDSGDRTPPSPPPLPDTGTTIALLRERVKQHTTTEPDQPPPREVLERPILPPEPPEVLSQTVDSLEQKIISAARCGLDHATISKKFQVSIDHVALLLKVAAKKGR